MTRQERLTIKLGGTVDSSLLAVCIEEAENDFKYLTGRDEEPAMASSLVDDMAMQRYQNNGNEGLASQSYSGISESYLSSYNDNIKGGISRFRKLKMI